MNEEPNDPLESNVSRLLRQPGASVPKLDPARRAAALAALLQEQARAHPPKSGFRWSRITKLAALFVASGLCLSGIVRWHHNQKPGLKLEITETLTSPERGTIEQLDSVRRHTLPDGTVLIIKRGTFYKVTGHRAVTLESGSLYCIVAKDPKPFRVTTPGGEATAVGTRFVVETTTRTKSGAWGTRVAVAQGKVLFADEQVRAGEECLHTPGKKPRRRPAARLSYLVNWAREALEESSGEKVTAGLKIFHPNGQESQLSLREYHVDVFIEDGIARTTVDQTFFNHLHSNAEGMFYFPLTPGASVSRLAMYVNGVRNEGGMVERGRGQQIYNEIKFQRRDPALLEKMEGNQYKLRIFPLEPRQEKRIFLSYTQPLEELYGTLRYWFPTEHTHSTAGKFSIRVRVKNGRTHFNPESSTHALRQSLEGRDIVLEFDATDVNPDRDLLLHLLPVRRTSEQTRFTTVEQDGHRYFFTKLTPRLDGAVSIKPRQWYVLNDVSASRTSDDIAAQASVLERLLVEADDADEVAVFNINTRVRPLTGGLVPVRGEQAAAIPEKVRQTRVLGASNLATAFDAARDAIISDGTKNPHILYLGDGVATDGEVSAEALTSTIPATATFVGISIGKQVDTAFLTRAANATGGAHFHINPDEDLNWRVFDLLAALNTPRVTELAWEFAGADGSILHATDYANRLTLADGETLAITARSEGPLPKTIKLTGKLDGAPWEQEFSLGDAIDGASYIPRFWASQHIDALLATGGDARRDEIVKLSKEFYVITPHTSLIVLENDNMYEEFNVEKGRSDHWASYSASDKIYVVREPMLDGSDSTEVASPNGNPQTPEEMTQAVLFTHDPFIPEELARFNFGIGIPDTGREVERLLRLGVGYYDLGQYDEARKRFNHVLGIDRNNTAARSLREKTDRTIMNLLRASRDQMRSDMLRQVDELWQVPVPNVSPVASAPVIEEVADAITVGSAGARGDGLDGWGDGTGGTSTTGKTGSISQGSTASRVSLDASAGNGSKQLVRAKTWAGSPDQALAWASSLRSTAETGSAPMLIASTAPFDGWLGGSNEAVTVSTGSKQAPGLGLKPYLQSVNGASLGFLDAAAVDWFRAKVEDDSLDEEGAHRFREKLSEFDRNHTIPTEISYPHSPIPKFLARPSYFHPHDETKYEASLFLLLPGLRSTDQDVRDLVAASFNDASTNPAAPPRDPRAIELLESARNRISAERIVFHGATDGYVITPDGSFSKKGHTSFGLEEHITSDGTQLLHHYPQLGIAARRVLSDERLERLSALAPHWVPSASCPASEGSLTLSGETAEEFTVLYKNGAESIEVVCGRDGYVRSRKLLRDGKFVRREVFSYGADGSVKIASIMPGRPESTMTYHTGSMNPTQAGEALKASYDDEVVFEMPLRIPAYYSNKLSQLDQEKKEDAQAVAERIRLLRHCVLVSLYDNSASPDIFRIHLLRETLQGQQMQLSKADQALYFARYGTPTKDGEGADVPALIRYLTDCRELASMYDSRGNRPTLVHVRNFLERWKKYSGSPLNLQVVGTVASRALFEETIPMWLELAKHSTHLPSRVEALNQVAARTYKEEFAELILEVHRKALASGDVVPWSVQSIERLQGNPQWDAMLEESFAKCNETDNVIGLVNLHAIAASNPQTKADGKWLPMVEAALQRLLGESNRVQAEWLLGSLKWAADDPAGAAPHFDNVVAACRESGLPVSQALLAVAARTHLQGGDNEEFVKLENASLLLAEAAGLSTSSNECRKRYGALWHAARLLLNRHESNSPQSAEDHRLLENIWNRWFKVDPDNDSMIGEMATEVQKSDGDEGAWEYLSTMIDLKPRDAQGYGAIAEWYLRGNRLNEAQQFYSAAHRYDTANPYWNSARLRVLYDIGRRAEADALYKEMLQTDWASGLERQIPKQIEIPLLIEGNQQMHKITGSRTTTPPVRDDWNRIDFDDSAWDEQWGTVRFTKKEQRPVWVRREFTAHAIPRELELRLLTLNARATVFINGIWAAEVGQLQMKQVRRMVSSKARSSIKPGENAVAIALQMINPEQHGGTGQFDLGLNEIFQPDPEWKSKKKK